MSKHNINNNSSKWVCRFWDTVHHDTLSKSFHEVLSTLDTWSVFYYFYHYLVIPFFYLYTFIYKSIPFIFNPSYSKQHHYPKYSLLLLNPISKQYYAASVVHNSISLEHMNTTLFLCNMITLVKDMVVSCLHIHCKCFYGS